jgi:PII-like signaling protein
VSQADSLKLTAYFGEHDRAGGRFLADALLDCFARHRVQTSVLLRGIEGFGLTQRLATQRLLTLSEDLPLVAVAVDARERIEQRVLPEVVAFGGHGLVTLERARLLVGRVRGVRFPEGLAEETKLTVYLGRRERARGAPAFLAVTDLLRRHGVAGATVLLGVDGTAVGFRYRARFVGRNAGVPLMVIAVGPGEAIARALPALGMLLERPLVTLERVRVCKRDGQRLAEPTRLPEADPAGRRVWQKLMVYASEEAQHDGHPLYLQLVRRLREAGASGATALRGMWGYHGDHAPHGDRLLALRRRVPVLTVIVDTPSRIRRWFEIVDELTDETGLVTSEQVPAFRTTGPGVEEGGLRLASWPAGEPPSG